MVALQSADCRPITTPTSYAVIRRWKVLVFSNPTRDMLFCPFGFAIVWLRSVGKVMYMTFFTLSTWAAPAHGPSEGKQPSFNLSPLSHRNGELSSVYSRPSGRERYSFQGCIVTKSRAHFEPSLRREGGFWTSCQYDASCISVRTCYQHRFWLLILCWYLISSNTCHLPNT